MCKSKTEEELASLLADLGRALDLNRPLQLPEPLPGLTFVGGRTLPVNGMPVVQLAYVDPDGQLFAFCFMRNRTGEIKEPKPQRIGDLTLDSWSDARFQYVVIGYEPLAFVTNIAQQLRDFSPVQAWFSFASISQLLNPLIDLAQSLVAIAI